MYTEILEGMHNRWSTDSMHFTTDNNAQHTEVVSLSHPSDPCVKQAPATTASHSVSLCKSVLLRHTRASSHGAHCVNLAQHRVRVSRRNVCLLANLHAHLFTHTHILAAGTCCGSC